jgi:hypothetical protein
MNFSFSFWKNVDDIPGVTYKTFQTYTTVNGPVVANGAVEAYYDYTSTSSGPGTLRAEFNNVGYSLPPLGSSVLITSCLPFDATNFTLVVGEGVPGGSPGTPTNSGVNC